MVAKAESLLTSESLARMPFGPVSLVGLCPTLPIFLKLPKLSPSRMGHYGQSQTPGQGQDTRQERGIWSVEMVVKAESLLSSKLSARMPVSPFRPLTVARAGIPLNLEL